MTLQFVCGQPATT